MHMTQHHLHKIKTQHRKYTKGYRLNPWLPIREGEWEVRTEEKGNEHRSKDLYRPKMTVCLEVHGSWGIQGPS